MRRRIAVALAVLAGLSMGAVLVWRRLTPPGGLAPPAAMRVASGTAWDLLALVRDDPTHPAEYSATLGHAYGETRAAITSPIPGRLTYPVTIPAGAVLDLGYAVQAAAFMNFVPQIADPTRFQVVLHQATGGDHVLLDRVVDLRGREADRRWFDERLDLGRYAGQAGTLTLSAVLVDDPEKRALTSALFSAPRILLPAAPDDVNILLVTIDCLRADHVGAYGYGRPTTPNLDRLARDGVRFAHAYSTAPMTLPSLPQLFTASVFPTWQQETFLAPLVHAGIPSAAVINNAWIALWLTVARQGAADNFDLFTGGDDHFDARAITDRALAWLERHRGDRFALYLHYLDAHSPYDLLPPEVADQFRDPAYKGPVGRTFGDLEGANAGRYDAADQAAVTALYDAGIRYVDTHLGRLLDALRRDGRLDRTVVAITADHGEELWDHGGFFHGQSLYDELLHVPLLVRLPGGARANTVVEHPVRSIEVAPALLAWANLPRPPGLAGASLIDAIAHPDAPPVDLVSTATIAQFPNRYALRTPEWKLIENVNPGTLALFDLAHDPAERHDLAAERPQVVATLRERLAAARAPLRQRGFQVRVLGPRAAAIRFRLTLDTPKDSGSFHTLDRTDGPPDDTTLSLSSDGHTLVIEGQSDGAGRAFRFDRLIQPFVAYPAGVDTVTLALEENGERAPSDRFALGPASAPPPDASLNTLDASLESASAPPCPAPDTGVRVCIWHYPEPHATGAPAVPDGTTRERLRALGYVQ